MINQHMSVKLTRFHVFILNIMFLNIPSYFFLCIPMKFTNSKLSPIKNIIKMIKFIIKIKVQEYFYLFIIIVIRSNLGFMNFMVSQKEKEKEK